MGKITKKPESMINIQLTYSNAAYINVGISFFHFHSCLFHVLHRNRFHMRQPQRIAHLTMKLHVHLLVGAAFQGHFFSHCRNIFPPNLVQATIQQYQTVLTPPAENASSIDMSEWKITGQYTEGKRI